MVRTKGWMLKQKIISGGQPHTVWENRGVRKYNKAYKKHIHVGVGTVLVAEKKKDKWVATKVGSGDKRMTLAKGKTRSDVEKKCRNYMKKHPMG